MSPRLVMLVRHAEKLGDPGDDAVGSPDLSVAGFARAAAMPTLFLPGGSTACALNLEAGTVHASFSAERAVASPPRFDRPDLILATRDSNQSSRPRQTASPTAAALGCPFDCTTYGHKPEDAAQLGADLLADEAFAEKVIVVFWHHGTIPAVAAALGVVPTPSWPGAGVFDRVWTITFGPTALTEVRQQLLYGDG